MSARWLPLVMLLSNARWRTCCGRRRYDVARATGVDRVVDKLQPKWTYFVTRPVHNLFGAYTGEQCYQIASC
ncbi:uncharacterized protein B0H18DRAFT_1012655 [Fomitopsis serialis]|uniref:uncharacterized protein n=1 Tax=Fomitopsis serialis TaxID=139415 RepID=UPI0020083333|nr:uncharacterized protein B0H18DRAFT_1012655 [Neoantrodia serialis]KAH9924167.1 hypothetical protein B0H18DRAFT_1012655 [Neoantrodia serialis]